MNSWRWVAALFLLVFIHTTAVAQTAKPKPLAQVPTTALAVSRDGVDLAAWLPFGENIENRNQIDVSILLASTTPVEGVVSIRLAGASQVTSSWPVAFGPGVATTTLVLPFLGQGIDDGESKIIVRFASETKGVRNQALELPYERWTSSQPNFGYYGYNNDSVSIASLYRILILSEGSAQQWELGLGKVAQTTTINPALLPVGTEHLANFSLVILGKRAADVLSPEQCATLAQWVRSGGQLLVTGGALSSPLAGPAFSQRFGITTESTERSTVPVTIALSEAELRTISGELESAKEYNQSNSYNRYSDDYGILPFDVPLNDKHPHWKQESKTAELRMPGYIQIDNGVRLDDLLPINRRVEGMGTITTTSAVVEGLFGSSSKGMRNNWVLLPLFGRHWLRSSGGYPSMNGLRTAEETQGQSPPHVWQSILTTWAGIAPIDWRIVLGFLVAFFFAVTVAERLVLGKLLKRLNWNWVTSLLIVVVFCLLAQTISYASRGLTSLRRSMVIEDYAIGSGQRTLTFNSVTPSLNRTLNLSLEHGSLLQIPEPGTEAQNVSLVAGMANTTMSTPSWTPCYFVSDSWDAQSTGPFSAKLTAQAKLEPVIRGTVHLDRPLDGELESAWLVWNGQLYILEEAKDGWRPQATPSSKSINEVGYDVYQKHPKEAGNTMAAVLLDCLANPSMAVQSARTFYPARVMLPDYPRDYAVVVCRYRSGTLPALTGLQMETESIHLIRQVVPVSYDSAANAD